MNETIFAPFHKFYLLRNKMVCVGFAILAASCALSTSAWSAAGDDEKKPAILKMMNFETLGGKWTGFGWFHFGIDTKKRARCEALISPDGGPNKGKIDLNCTGEGIEIGALSYDIVLDGNNANGLWTMRTHEVDGALKGMMEGNRFDANLIPEGQPEEGGYYAQLKTILTDKCHASIKIDVNAPIDLKHLDVAVRRC